MSILSNIKEHYLINHESGCLYLFQDMGANLVVVHIDDGHGWRPYDSARIAGNYETPMARTFWNSLIKQGFVTNEN